MKRHFNFKNCLLVFAALFTIAAFLVTVTGCGGDDNSDIGGGDECECGLPDCPGEDCDCDDNCDDDNSDIGGGDECECGLPDCPGEDCDCDDDCDDDNSVIGGGDECECGLPDCPGEDCECDDDCDDTGAAIDPEWNRDNFDILLAVLTKENPDDNVETFEGGEATFLSFLRNVWWDDSAGLKDGSKVVFFLRIAPDFTVEFDGEVSRGVLRLDYSSHVIEESETIPVPPEAMFDGDDITQIVRGAGATATETAAAWSADIVTPVDDDFDIEKLVMVWLSAEDADDLSNWSKLQLDPSGHGKVRLVAVEAWVPKED